MQIKTFSEFITYINNDSKQKNINIIRFINVESLDLWIKVKNYLGEKCNNHIRLSKEYCAGPDIIPNISLLLKDLKNIKNDSMLYPLSEYLRINTENAFNILSNITFLQFINDVYSENVRLYIPVYKMRNSLTRLLKTNERLNDSIIFLEENFDDDYSLTIISKDLNVKLKGNNVFGLKSYFEYWEDNPSKPIILHTDNAQYYKDRLFEENVRILVTAYDILEYHDLIGIKVQEEWGADWQWRELLSKLQYANKIEVLFEKSFKINKFNETLLLSQWKEHDDFNKWLIWLWTKIDCRNKYFNNVISSSININDLVTLIVEKILEISYRNPEYNKLFLERKEMLSALNLDELIPSFWEKFEKLSTEEKFFRLTNCTRRERVEFIKLIGQSDLSNKMKEFLEDTYPGLYGYINEYPLINKNYTDYFRDYKVCKLKNDFSSEFIDLVTAIAAEKGAETWKLSLRNKLVEQYYDQNTLILWVDNLSVDDIGLIQYALSKNYKSVHFLIDIGIATLPTITEKNKDFMVGRNFKQYKFGVLDLDEIKHSGEYPEYISDEIDIVLNIVKLAVNDLGAFSRIIITSDHGASRGAVIVKGQIYKAKDGAQVERHGRYCIDTKNQYEKEIESCFDIDEYHIMGNYDRFSISGNIKGEIHGGATLEEMLVPVIVLSQSPLEEKAHIERITELIRPQNNIVKFKVDRDYEKLYANVETKRYECIKKDDYWYFALEIGKNEEYLIRITAKGNVGEFIVKVSKGRIDNKKFDL